MVWYGGLWESRSAHHQTPSDTIRPHQTLTTSRLPSHPHICTSAHSHTLTHSHTHILSSPILIFLDVWLSKMANLNWNDKGRHNCTSAHKMWQKRPSNFPSSFLFGFQFIDSHAMYATLEILIWPKPLPWLFKEFTPTEVVYDPQHTFSTLTSLSSYPSS